MKKFPEHLQYAQDVVDGKIIVGEYVRLRCEMSLEDFYNPPDDWFFDKVNADAPITFIENLPHVKGSEWTKRNPVTGERERIILEPWMKYFISECWGWYSKDGTGRRRYNNSFLQVGKKNAKSTVGAGLCLYETFCGDDGGEIYSAASTQSQSKHSWGAAAKMVPLVPELEDDAKVLEESISSKDTNSVYVPLVGRSKHLDGINPSMILLDEAGAIEDRVLVETLVDSFGARRSGMLMRITTAYPYDNTIWLEDRQRNIQNLKDKVRTREFALLYEMDEDDEHDDERNWRKANPSLGTIKDAVWMRDEYEKCLSSPAKLNAFLLKQLNVYTGTTESQWLETFLWERLPEFEQELPKSSKRVGACDMAHNQDLAAVCFRHSLPGKNSFLTFKCFAAEASLESVPKKYYDTIKKLYDDAQEEGILHVAPGFLIDFDEIEKYLREEYDRMPWDAFGYDPYRKHDLFLNLAKDAIPVGRLNQNMANLNAATVTVEGMIKEKRYFINHSPFLKWQFQNAARYEDKREQVLVRHFTNMPYRKMDAMIAMIMAERMFDINESTGEESFYFGTF